MVRKVVVRKLRPDEADGEPLRFPWLVCYSDSKYKGLAFRTWELAMRKATKK